MNSAFSALRSQAIPKRRPSLQENLLSYESRNYNFNILERFSSPEDFGHAMAMNVMRNCLDLEKVAEMRDEIIAITEKGFREWCSKRSPSQLKALEADLQHPLLLEEEIIKFKLMVKRDAKVKLDSSCLQKHPPAQNIMFHRKAINAIYSPCFDEFKNRFLSSLNPNIVFFTEMTNQTFASVVGNMLNNECSYEVGEIDFSKYDKSQDAFIKAYEKTLYTEFGFDPELLSIWMEGEYRSDATTLDGQLSFTVENQRKSGASNTWIGNSIVTLGILAMFYNLEKFKGVFISGDDSLLFSDAPIANHAEEICSELGFETKFLNPSVPYFCSKFLVILSNKTYFVPDPYKLLVKLGAIRDEVEDEDLFEVFTSFRDLTKDLVDERVLVVLALMVNAKYGLESGNTFLALCTIHCLRANFSSFAKIYPRRKGWKVFFGKYKSLFKRVKNFLRYSVEPIYSPFGEAYFLHRE